MSSSRQAIYIEHTIKLFFMFPPSTEEISKFKLNEGQLISIDQVADLSEGFERLYVYLKSKAFNQSEYLPRLISSKYLDDNPKVFHKQILNWAEDRYKQLREVAPRSKYVGLLLNWIEFLENYSEPVRSNDSDLRSFEWRGKKKDSQLFFLLHGLLDKPAIIKGIGINEFTELFSFKPVAEVSMKLQCQDGMKGTVIYLFYQLSSNGLITENRYSIPGDKPYRLGAIVEHLVQDLTKDQFKKAQAPKADKKDRIDKLVDKLKGQ